MKPWIRACGILAAAFLLTAPSGYSQERPAIEAERLARTMIDLMGHGKRLLGQGDVRRAAMEFEKVLQFDPSNSAAADLLSRCVAAVSCGTVQDSAR